LARLAGTIEELLQDPAHTSHEGSWVQATLTDDTRPLQAMDRLRRRFPHTLVIGFEATGSGLGALPASRTHGRTDHDIAHDFMLELRGAPPTDEETTLLFRAVDACCDDPDFDTVMSEEEPG
jgi:exonuclease SbcD